MGFLVLFVSLLFFEFKKEACDREGRMAEIGEFSKGSVKLRNIEEQKQYKMKKTNSCIVFEWRQWY